MPYVITQSCCSDASCVYACPVNCIHPTPDEPDFGTAEMLHVDPEACVDCGACVTACPVDAIVPDRTLRPEQRPFLTINADFYKTPRPRPTLAPVVPAAHVRGRGLRVAIVGSGPAAMYAADELLTQPGAQVDVYERSPVPYGLARYGVAPDHVETRQVTRLFDRIAAQPGFRLHLGVEVGRDVTAEQLRSDHSAVIYAVGASAERRLDVPGADLAVPATEFVGWYNGHPDAADRAYDLSRPRVVVVGNGNVALDVARILTTDPGRLAGTGIAPRALAALRESRVEEVVVVGRRGPAQSAFTGPELVGLLAVPDVDVVLPGGAPATPDGAPHALAQKLRLLRELPAGPGRGRRRIVLRYLGTPVGVRPDGIELARTELASDGTVIGSNGREFVAAGLVLTSIGYRGRPVAGLPFDAAAGVVPNEGGRVEPGTYVAGWIKRSPTGFIGTNKSCAQETVRALVADHNAGLLASTTLCA